MRARPRFRESPTWLAAVAALLTASCIGPPPNAVLELGLEIPAGDERASFAVVQVRGGPGASFNDSWGPPSVDGFPLTDAPTRVDLSVVGAIEEDVLAPVLVRVRFCPDPRCEVPREGGGAAPEWRLEIERALYFRERTELVVAVAELPADVSQHPALGTPVSKCVVRGCSDEERASYCDGERHLCE